MINSVTKILIGILGTVFFATTAANSQTKTLQEELSGKIIPTAIEAFKSNPLIMRRDPSDVIKVDSLFYVWYTRRRTDTSTYVGDDGTSGYWADVWYATSFDGIDWTEKGIAVGKGGKGAWDEQSVFTPGILVADNKYYLYYTAVRKPFENNNTTDFTAIGMASADSPDGPWRKYENNPVLKVSNDTTEFDSYRVDDASVIMRDNKYWMYYKGRFWNGSPGETKMGVAIAEEPLGPYVKYENNPVVASGHEVIAWTHRDGVATGITKVGPEKNTIMYAPDGLNLSVITPNLRMLIGSGAYRPDAFNGSKHARGMSWGIHLYPSVPPWLRRYDVDFRHSVDTGLENGLITHWSFDNRWGSVVEDSRGEYHGRYRGSTSRVDGILNKGIKFNSSSIEFPAIMLSEDFTMTAWINLTSATNSKGVLLGFSKNENAFRVNQQKLEFQHNGKTLISSNTNISVDTWTHVSLVRKDSVLQVYLDGAKQGETKTEIVDFMVNRIGRGSQGFFGGLMDEITIFNRPLASTEIKDLMAGIEIPANILKNSSIENNRLKITKGGEWSFLLYGAENAKSVQFTLHRPNGSIFKKIKGSLVPEGWQAKWNPINSTAEVIFVKAVFDDKKIISKIVLR